MDRGACCSPWSHKESNMTEWLSTTTKVYPFKFSEKPTQRACLQVSIKCLHFFPVIRCYFILFLLCIFRWKHWKIKITFHIWIWYLLLFCTSDQRTERNKRALPKCLFVNLLIILQNQWFHSTWMENLVTLIGTCHIENQTFLSTLVSINGTLVPATPNWLLELLHR